MPVPPQIGSMLGDDHEMAYPRADVTPAAGTGIEFSRLVGLDGFDHEGPQR